MIDLAGSIHSFSKEIKILIAIFLIVLSTGFISALQFVNLSTEASTTGIQENYLGNEEDVDAEVMKFKKNEKEMFSIIHTHILSMSVIFFILSLLLSTTSLKGWLRKILLVEPLISVLLTFGGIYFLWKGIFWMKYIVMISGTFMTLSFVLSVIIILKFLLKRSSQMML